MSKHKFLNLVFSIMIVASLMLSGSFSASAQKAQLPSSAGAAGPASPTDETKVPHYFGPYPNWANSPRIRKFVDTLPALGPAGTNNLGQHIPVAVPDQTTYPGSDYYEIALVQYREQMHSDLPPTLLREYVQLSTSVVPGAHVPLANANLDGTTTPITINGSQIFGVDNVHYLGPLIIARKDRPVRVKFVNALPSGSGGDLFIPVDNTIMGAGPFEINYDPMTKEMLPDNVTGTFPQNRATLHLHGGKTPWISDGTPIRGTVGNWRIDEAVRRVESKLGAG